MIVVTLLLPLSLVAVTVLSYLLGFRLGGQSWIAEVERVRADAAAAERELHDLTRAAFVAMTEEADRRRREA